MRTRFDEQLEQLNNRLIHMGVCIQDAIAVATKALIEQDKVLAHQAIENDALINEMEKEIESSCLKLIMHQQPIARDLRLISTALKMITDMERIGDHAADISEITVILADAVYIKRLEHIPEMAKETSSMVRRSIEAYVNKDLEQANSVIRHDDIVDDLFCRVRHELIELIHADATNGEQALDLLMIAKYFERIGDHAVNIAEWVIFSITGEHKNIRII